jgi:RimJ/RimL family protein N-acetyltransferase
VQVSDTDDNGHRPSFAPAPLRVSSRTLAQLSVQTQAPGSGSGYGPGVAHDTPSWEQICLSTERLCLRTPTPQDAEAMHELFADPVVMHGLNRKPVSELDETRAMIEGGADGWRTNGLGPFILETATDRRRVGQAGLMIFDTRDWTPSTWTSAGSHAQPELGWALIRAHWGFGYATEAAAAIRTGHTSPDPSICWSL